VKATKAQLEAIVRAIADLDVGPLMLVEIREHDDGPEPRPLRLEVRDRWSVFFYLVDAAGAVEHLHAG
jgi:hypothetical protein